MNASSLSLHFLRSPVYAGLLSLALCLLVPGHVNALDDEQARHLYAKAQKELSGGDLDEAQERFLVLVNKAPRTEWSAMALWELYRIGVHTDDPASAFEALNRLIIEQPGHFEKAHSAQLELVRRLLEGGESRRALEVKKKKPKIPAEVLVDMLRVVIKNGPQSEVGIQAHYYLAVAQERAGEKLESKAAHEDFAENYPHHELADDAGYQAAYIAYKEWKNMRSMGPHQREGAAVALAWFIARFPESDKTAQARSCLAEVKASEMREVLGLARYYESKGNLKAASVYYEQLLQRFPEVVERDEALMSKIVAAQEGNSRETSDDAAVGPLKEGSR